MLMFQMTPDSDDKPKRRKPNRASSTNALLFIGSFLLCVAVFVGIMVANLPSWLDDMNVPFLGDPAPTTTTTQAPVLSPYTQEDRVSMAVYITDDENNLQTAVLAVFQPDIGRVELAGLPAQTALPDGENDSLSRRFQTGGASSAQLGLLSVIGKSVDYYIVIRYSDVAAYLTALDETLDITLTKDIDWSSADGNHTLSLTSGKHTLSPKQTANFLRCDNWQGGRRERTNQHAALIGAYLEQFLDPSRSLAADRNALQSFAQTNLSSEQFALTHASLTYLAEQNNGELCHVIPVDGEFEGAGTSLRFVLSDDVADAVSDTFG